jgi:hypothetical protein
VAAASITIAFDLFDAFGERLIEKVKSKVQSKVEEKIKKQALKGDLEKQKWRTRAAQVLLTALTTYGIVMAIITFAGAQALLETIAFIVSSVSLLFRAWRLSTKYVERCKKLDETMQKAVKRESTMRQLSSLQEKVGEMREKVVGEIVA